MKPGAPRVLFKQNHNLFLNLTMFLCCLLFDHSIRPCCFHREEGAKRSVTVDFMVWFDMWSNLVDRDAIQPHHFLPASHSIHFGLDQSFWLNWLVLT